MHITVVRVIMIPAPTNQSKVVNFMNKFFNGYNLKIIAIIGMILQHTAIILEELIPFALQIPMHFAGGLTFPIMAFFLVEGYKHTSNVKKYLGRIFLFAVISQIPYLWAYQAPSVFYTLNIMFILFLGLLMIHLHETMHSRGLFWFLFSVFLLISITMEWGIIGFLMILMYKVISKEKSRRFWPSFLSTLTHTILGLIGMGAAAIIAPFIDEIPEFAELAELGLDFSVQTFSLVVLFGLGSFFAIFFLQKYNGARGKNMKYLFYIIYPLHFIILGLLLRLTNL